MIFKTQKYFLMAKRCIFVENVFNVVERRVPLWLISSSFYQFKLLVFSYSFYYASPF